MSATQAPVIIVRKTAGHGGHHGGSWKVAYADFVTALMALFIVLWLMHASPEVQKAVAGYFKDPKGTGRKTGTSMAGSGEGVTLTKTNMKELQEKLKQALHKRSEFKALKENVEITITSEGLRVELLESEKGMFFETGQAIPTKLGKDLLEQFAKELAKLKNPILIEGHTDSKPYGSSNYTNWELSADRANSARRYMREQGLDEHQITQVRGFADQQLRNPQNPQDPSNRRVSIVVRYPEVIVQDDANEAKETAEGGHNSKESKLLESMLKLSDKHEKPPAREPEPEKVDPAPKGHH